jgi:hypothetical protein
MSEPRPDDTSGVKLSSRIALQTLGELQLTIAVPSGSLDTLPSAPGPEWPDPSAEGRATAGRLSWPSGRGPRRCRLAARCDAGPRPAHPLSAWVVSNSTAHVSRVCASAALPTLPCTLRIRCAVTITAGCRNPASRPSGAPRSRSTTSPELGIEPHLFVGLERRLEITPDPVLAQRPHRQGDGVWCHR